MDRRSKIDVSSQHRRKQKIKYGDPQVHKVQKSNLGFNFCANVFNDFYHRAQAHHPRRRKRISLSKEELGFSTGTARVDATSAITENIGPSAYYLLLWRPITQALQHGVSRVHENINYLKIFLSPVQLHMHNKRKRQKPHRASLQFRDLPTQTLCANRRLLPIPVATQKLMTSAGASVSKFIEIDFKQRLQKQGLFLVTNTKAYSPLNNLQRKRSQRKNYHTSL